MNNKYDIELKKLLKWFLLMQLPYISIGIITNNIVLVIIIAVISSLIYFGYIMPKIYKGTEEEDD